MNERIVITICGCGHPIAMLVHEASLIAIEKVESIAELFESVSNSMVNWFDEWHENELFVEPEKYPLIRKIVLKSQCVPKRFMRLARSRL